MSEEYIKKEDALTAICDCCICGKNGIYHCPLEEHRECTEDGRIAIDHLSTYSIPKTASSGEYIRKADMERILYSTSNAVRIGEEFLELPTYAIPDIEKIRAEIEKVAEEEADCTEWSRGLRYALKIIDKHIGGNK